jgi:3-methyladenine DNA glycosylase AlkD
LQAAPELLKSEKFEEISFGLLLINGFEKQYTKPLFDEIGTWFAFSIHNWAHADTLGMFVLPKFTKNNIIQLEDFKPWLISPFKFQRRCIPVTLIKSLKTSPDFNSFFQFIEPLVMDPEREVHQGVGWFLREAWKKKREETEAFLLKWKDRAPRLIIQYATEKMTSEEKLRFRRVK